jgi:hypothetical protein
MAKPKKIVEDTKGASKVGPCTCSHDYQDSLYGPGKRMKNRQKDGKLECTVCGRG